ncbi:MAG: hypothetical protein EOO44_13905 [Flavobacterium sp.]|jgi:hypothetical protein|nr:MAG: hypothetical protein EOO44_13905 [Flavobacterium sp.]
MNIEKSKEINQQIEFGLDSLNEERTIEIKLKDFMLMYKTFEEFNRFFHQPAHYPTIEDLDNFLGNRDFGAYSIIHKMYYEVLNQYIPKDIQESLDADDSVFDHPDYPFYYNLKE